VQFDPQLGAHVLETYLATGREFEELGHTLGGGGPPRLGGFAGNGTALLLRQGSGAGIAAVLPGPQTRGLLLP
jgi:hypothetical protein